MTFFRYGDYPTYEGIVISPEPQPETVWLGESGPGEGTSYATEQMLINPKGYLEPWAIIEMPDEGANFNWDYWRAENYMDRIRVGPDEDSGVGTHGFGLTQYQIAGRNSGILHDEDRCYAAALMCTNDTDIWEFARGKIYSDQSDALNAGDVFVDEHPDDFPPGTGQVVAEPLLPVSEAGFDLGNFTVPMNCDISADLFDHGAAGIDVTVRLYQEPLHYTARFPTIHFAFNKGTLLRTYYFRTHGEQMVFTMPVPEAYMYFPEAGRDFYGINVTTNTDDITLGLPWHFDAYAGLGTPFSEEFPFMTYTEHLPRWRYGWSEYAPSAPTRHSRPRKTIPIRDVSDPDRGKILFHMELESFHLAMTPVITQGGGGGE